MKVKKATAVVVAALAAFAGFSARAAEPDYLSFTSSGGDAELVILEVSGTKSPIRNLGNEAEAVQRKSDLRHGTFQYSFDRVKWTDFQTGFWNELNRDWGACPEPGEEAFKRVIAEGAGKVPLSAGQTVYLRRAGKLSVNALTSVDGDGYCTIGLFATGGAPSVEPGGSLFSLLDCRCTPRFLGPGAFRNLFFGCALLTKAPKLPCAPLVTECYAGMFANCTSLTNAPALPAKTLAEGCYEGMFRGCVGLCEAPALPATNLAARCYKEMFMGCASLTNAPALPVTKLPEECYKAMFADCKNLSEVSVGFSVWPGSGATDKWLAGVAPAGTFRCPLELGDPAAEGLAPESSIPEGWSVVSPETVTLTFPTGEKGLQSVRVENRTHGDLCKTVDLTGDSGEATYVAHYGDEIVLTYVPFVGYEITDDPEQKLGNVLEDRTFSPDELPALTFYGTPDYLSFTARGGEAKIVGQGNWEYSFDPTALVWTNCNAGIVLADGAKVYVRRDASEATSYGNSFEMTGAQPGVTVEAGGNVMSLIDATCRSKVSSDHAFESLFEGCTILTTPPRLPATDLRVYCYCAMFAGCSSLTNAPALPATALAEGCYNQMFAGCSLLTDAPALPATELADGCCYAMFADCGSFTNAPALPALKLADICYASMFANCTNLVEAPALPATELAMGCYRGLFAGCSALAESPELPAAELAEYCYSSMFEDCTALTVAPQLPALELDNECYARMFADCGSLTDAPALPATELAMGCYKAMFDGCGSLTNAPALPAAELADECYAHMFDSCSNLTAVTVAFTEWDTWSTFGWLEGTAEGGVLNCSPVLAETLPCRNTDTIPQSWTFGCEVSDWALLRFAVVNNERDVSLSCEPFDHTNRYDEAADMYVNFIRLKKDITATDLSTLLDVWSESTDIDLDGHVLDRGLADKEPREDGCFFRLYDPYLTLSVHNGTLTGGNCVGSDSVVGDGWSFSLAGDMVVTGNFATVGCGDLNPLSGTVAVPEVGAKMLLGAPVPVDSLTPGEPVCAVTDCPDANIVNHIRTSDVDILVSYSNDTQSAYLTFVPFANTTKLHVPTNVTGVAPTVIDAQTGAVIPAWGANRVGGQVYRVAPGTDVEVHLDPRPGYVGESKVIALTVTDETMVNPLDYPSAVARCVVRFETDEAKVRSLLGGDDFPLLGEVLPAGATVKGEGVYEQGKKVTLTAKPPKGYKFAGWWDLRPMLDDPVGGVSHPLPLMGAAIAEDYRAPKVTLTAVEGVQYDLVPLFVRPEQDLLNLTYRAPLPSPVSTLAGTADDAAVTLMDEARYDRIMGGGKRTKDTWLCFSSFLPDGVRPGCGAGRVGSYVEALEFTAGEPVASRIFVFSGSLPIVSVTGLPKGVKFDRKSGRLTGTPTVPGVTYATFSVKNASGYVTAKTVACSVRNFDRGVKIENDVIGRLDLLENRYVEDELNMAGSNGYVRLQVGDSLGFRPTFIPRDADVTVKKIAKKTLPSGLKYDAQTGYITGAIKKPGSYAAVFNVTLSTGETVPCSMIFFADEQGFAYPGRQIDIVGGKVRCAYGKEEIPQGEGMSTIAYLCSRCQVVNGVTGLGVLLTTRNVKFAVDNAYGATDKSLTDQQCFLELDRYIPVGTSLNGAFAYGYEGRTDYSLPIAVFPTAKDNYIKAVNLPTGLKLVAKKCKPGDIISESDLAANQLALDPEKKDYQKEALIRLREEVTLYSIDGTATKPGVYLTKWEICHEGSKSVFNRRYVVTAGPSGFFRVKPYCFSFDTVSPEVYAGGGLSANIDWFKDVGGLEVTGGGVVFTPTSKLKFKATAKPGFAFCGWCMSQAFDYLMPRKEGKTRSEPYEYGTTSPDFALSPHMAKSYAFGYMGGAGRDKPSLSPTPTNLAVRVAYVPEKDDFCCFMYSVPKSSIVDYEVPEIDWTVGEHTKTISYAGLGMAAVGISDMTITPVGDLPAGFALEVEKKFVSGARQTKEGYPNGRSFMVTYDLRALQPGVHEFDIRAENRSGQSATLHVRATVLANMLEYVSPDRNLPYSYFDVEYQYIGRYEDNACVSNTEIRPVANFTVERGRTYAATADNPFYVCTWEGVDSITTEPALPEGLSFLPVPVYSRTLPVKAGIDTGLKPLFTKWYLVGKTTASLDSVGMKVIANVGVFRQTRNDEYISEKVEDGGCYSKYYPEWVDHPYTEFHVVDAVTPVPEPSTADLRVTVAAGIGRQFGPNRLPYVPCYVTNEQGVITGTAPCAGERAVPVNGELTDANRDLCCAVGVPVVLDLGTDASVTVTGLPKGLKLAAKPVKDKQLGEIAANSIYGKPAKPGTNEVTVAKAGTSESYTFRMIVLPTPDWATGTFEGVLNLGAIDVVSTLFDASDVDLRQLEGDVDWKDLVLDFGSQYWRNVGFGPLGAIMTAAKGVFGTATGKLTLKVGKDGKISGTAKILGKAAKVTVTGFDSARIATAKIDPSWRDEGEPGRKFVSMALPWRIESDPMMEDKATGGSGPYDLAPFFDTTTGKIRYWSFAEGRRVEWTPVAADGQPTFADKYNILLRERAAAMDEFASAETVLLNEEVVEFYCEDLPGQGYGSACQTMMQVQDMFVRAIAPGFRPTPEEFESVEPVDELAIPEGGTESQPSYNWHGCGLVFQTVDIMDDFGLATRRYLRWCINGFDPWHYLRLETDVPTVGQLCRIADHAWREFKDRWADMSDRDGVFGYWKEEGSKILKEMELMRERNGRLAEDVGELNRQLDELPRATYDRYVETEPYVDAYTAQATVKWDGKTFTTSVTLTELNRKTRELLLAADTSITNDIVTAGVPGDAANWKPGSSVGTMILGPKALVNGIGYDETDDQEWFDLIALASLGNDFSGYGEALKIRLDEVYLHYNGDRKGYRDWGLDQLKWLRSKAFGVATQKSFGTSYTLPSETLKLDAQALADGFGAANGVVRILVDALGRLDILSRDTLDVAVSFGKFTKAGEVTFTADVNYNGVKTALKFAGTALPLAVVSSGEPLAGYLKELADDTENPLLKTLLSCRGTVFIANCAAVVPKDLEVNGVVLLKKGATVFVPVPFVLDEEGLVDRVLSEALVNWLKEKVGK